MDKLSIILLVISAVLSAGRNIMSKGISGYSFKTGNFFLSQSVLLISGAAVLLVSGEVLFNDIAPVTVIYAIIYGILLISAQWCYTAALAKGNTAVCSTVYSLGFVFPTLSGTLFWNEQMSGLNFSGILCVLQAIIISGMKNNTEGAKGNYYIFPLIIAMLSSGGLGIMQKLQQSTAYPEQRSVFVFLAFIFAGTVSSIFSLTAKQKAEKLPYKKLLSASGAGICFGCCNLLNTVLAGRLDSAVFYPTLNIGTILLSAVAGIIIFRERPGIKEAAVLILGITSILLINI